MSCRQAWLVVALVSTVTVARADTAQVETGERVYGDYCSSCHGEELRNTSAGVTFDLRRLRAGDQERFARRFSCSPLFRQYPARARHRHRRRSGSSPAPRF
jgi:cytochrome c1